MNHLERRRRLSGKKKVTPPQVTKKVSVKPQPKKTSSNEKNQDQRPTAPQIDD